MLPPFVVLNWICLTLQVAPKPVGQLWLAIFPPKTPKVWYLTTLLIYYKLRWVKTHVLFEVKPHLICYGFLLIRHVNCMFLSTYDLMFEKTHWSFLSLSHFTLNDAFPRVIVKVLTKGHTTLVKYYRMPLCDHLPTHWLPLDLFIIVLNCASITISWNKGGFPIRVYFIINSDVQPICFKSD